LEKNGFEFEKLLRRHQELDHSINSKLSALVKQYGTIVFLPFMGTVPGVTACDPNFLALELPNSFTGTKLPQNSTRRCNAVTARA
jgi:hypothetical protein